MLMAMATGTGKHFTMVNEVYRLMKPEVGKRVLFLVDRRALAAQAVRAFASFEAGPSKNFDKICEVHSQGINSSMLLVFLRYDGRIFEVNGSAWSAGGPDYPCSTTSK